MNDRLTSPEQLAPNSRPRWWRPDDVSLFVVLGTLGAAASYLSVNIPHTEVFVEGRWVFGFLGFALFRHWRSALLLACLLCVTGPHKVPLGIVFLGNMSYTVPAMIVLRLVHNRFLVRLPYWSAYGAAWFVLVLVCYQAFHTPLIMTIMALLRDQPVWPMMVSGWVEQPFFIESVLVGLLSAAGLVAFRSHDALKRSLGQMDATLQSIGDGVIVTDAAGRVSRLNPVAEALTGWSFSEAVGRPLADVFRIVNAKTGEAVDNPAQRVLAGGVTVGLANHTSLIARDGSRRQIADSAAPIRDAAGRLIGAVMVFRDVTEAYQSAEALAENQRQLDLALQAAAMGVWDWEIDTGRVKWAGQQAELFGISGDEFGGTMDDVQARVHPDDRDRGMEAIQETITQGNDFDNVYRIIRPDGAIRWMHSYGRPIRDESGRPVRIAGTTRDITERKRADDQLRLQSLTLKQIEDLVTVTDLDGDITYVNEAVCRMLGKEPEELIGRHVSVFGDNPDTGARQEDIVGQAREHGVWRGEVTNYGADGRPVVLDSRVFLVKDESGRPIAMCGVSTDVTHRKQAEKALRRSEEKFSLAFRTSPYVITITRAKDGRIVDVNQAFTTVSGYTREEALADSSVNLRLWYDENDRDQLIRDVLAGRPAVGREYWFRKKSGEIMIGLFSAHVIYLDDEPHVLSSINDITDRKRAEQELGQLNAQLAAKNAELEQVVYVASHDLRSPLVNIDGYARELEQSIADLGRTLAGAPNADQIRPRVAPYLDEDIPEALRFIRTSAYKMDTLLTGLLRLSRSGRAALSIEPLDMNTLMERVVDAMEFQIKESGAEVILEDLPACRGDAMQVNQVFSNLLNNAVKYLDPDRPGRIRIGGRREEGRAVYLIEDNGIGVEPAYLDKIFEIFHRLEPTANQGEGLGLTIVKRVVERLDGSVWAESEPGRGSRFYVALPAAGRLERQ